MLALRALTDADEDAVVLSLDGIGAFDHVKRAAFMSKLMEIPSLKVLLPLVTALYGSVSRSVWYDEHGAQTSKRKITSQSHPGEQQRDHD